MKKLYFKVFLQKVVLKNFAALTRKYLSQVLSFVLLSVNLLKKELNCGYFFAYLAIFFWTYSLQHLWSTASVFRCGCRTATSSKMELFVIIVDSFQPLTIITKSSILDVAAALDPALLFISRKMVQFERVPFSWFQNCCR